MKGQGTAKAASNSPWIAHIRVVMAEQKLNYRDAMIEAQKSYKKVPEVKPTREYRKKAKPDSTREEIILFNEGWKEFHPKASRQSFVSITDFEKYVKKEYKWNCAKAMEEYGKCYSEGVLINNRRGAVVAERKRSTKSTSSRASSKQELIMNEDENGDMYFTDKYGNRVSEEEGSQYGSQFGSGRSYRPNFNLFRK